MATIIIFASSLILLVLLIVLKALELRFGTKNSILGYIGRFDEKTEQALLKAKFFTLQLIQSIRYILLVHIRELIVLWFDTLHKKLIDSYSARRDTIMGKRDLSHSGSASFYLKKITEDKNDTEKGMILDESLPKDNEE